MKRSRILFYVSCALIGCIVLLAAFGGLLKPHGLSEADEVMLIEKVIDGKKAYFTPPFEPGPTYPLGSDHRGLDLVSLLMNGLKYTLALAGFLTLLRFLIALPLGLWSGTTGRGRGFLRTMQWAVSAVPAFLLLFPTLGGMYFGLGLNQTSAADPGDYALFLVVFFALVTILGVFPLAYQISERARFYNEKSYVHASRLMGGSFFHRIFKHILLSMRLELVYTFISEFVLVLFLMGQFAVFNILIGGSDTLQMNDPLPGETPEYIYLTMNGEWTSLIAYGAHYIGIYPFIVLNVGLCYLGLIFSLQFFMHQFKKRFGGLDGAE